MATSTFLQTVKNIRSSKSLEALSEFWAGQMGYRRMGLVYDDLIPEENPLVQEAVRRLPPREFQDRLYRFRTAFNLNIGHNELPKKEWVTAEQLHLLIRSMTHRIDHTLDH
ncbi:Cytochrome b-c1 complex subunit 7 [Nowakowskiella sp. JEL0078]|nr:Cytochrome b-c1 complex subunit 7 [Nowakowskiella sp. JEL0078]